MHTYIYIYNIIYIIIIYIYRIRYAAFGSGHVGRQNVLLYTIDKFWKARCIQCMHLALAYRMLQDAPAGIANRFDAWKMWLPCSAEGEVGWQKLCIYCVYIHMYMYLYMCIYIQNDTWLHVYLPIHPDPEAYFMCFLVPIGRSWSTKLSINLCNLYLSSCSNL